MTSWNNNADNSMIGNIEEVIEQTEQAIEHEESEILGERVMIDDINIITQMSTSQLAIEEEEDQRPSTHNYNLRECPTRGKQQISLAEAMVLSCAIDAKEGRYVVVTDIPGAFLHADMEGIIHMVLEGTISELIVKLEPNLYRKHVWYNQKGKPMLYIQLKKALYGTLQAALLF